MFWRRKKWLLYLVVLSPFLIAGNYLNAQELSPFENYAEYLLVEDEGVQDGDIVTLTDNRFNLAKAAYDSGLYGVVNEEPAVGLKDQAGGGMVPVVTGGTAFVRVSTKGGPIKQGDWITSSDKPGVGMKANQPGVAVGTALEAYEVGNQEEVGKIRVALNVRYATVLEGRELQDRSVIDLAQNLLTTGAASVIKEPNTWMKYLIAAMVVILSIVLGMMIFGRSATHGVIAIGRNPLARRSILLAVSFNVFLTVVFAAVGLAAAFFILAT